MPGLSMAIATMLFTPAALIAQPAVPVQADLPVARARTEHVVIVSVDGLRPDAIQTYGASTLQRLMREGAYTLTAQTILPSKTLPSHTSMLTGVDADQHGVTWNSDEVDEHGHVDVPTVFALAKQAGYTTAAFFAKTKFHHLEAPNSLDHVRSPSGGTLTSRFAWVQTLEMVEQYLESDAKAPNLMFIHIAEPDYAGHVFGWMSTVYGMAVKQADRAIGEVIDEANDRFGAGNYTLIVTADHGGHGREHGSDDPRDTTIPWIVWGKGVQPGASLSAVQTMDTAASALFMLGIETPSNWVGKPIAQAFNTITVAATSN